MREIKMIVIHAADTPKGVYFDVNDIRKWHTDPKPKGRGWSDIGYHFVILLDGTIQIGRPIENIGAHVKGYNKNSIGICYIGGKGKDTRTVEQKVSLIYLIGSLKRQFRGAVVYGHRDLSPDTNKDGTIEPSEWLKDCPLFNAQKEYKNI